MFKIKVDTAFWPEHSDPANDVYVFVYTIQITNVGQKSAQLLSRHWVITDGFGTTREVRGDARYFTAPNTVTQSAKMSGILGKLMVNGVASAVVTGAKISIDLGASSEAVVGSNVAPDVYIGSVKVDGSLTCYFNDASMRAAANADTAMSLALRVDASSAIASDYVAIVLPAIKLSMPSLDDGEKLLTQSINFTAYPAVFGALAATTIAIQDTLA